MWEKFRNTITGLGKYLGGNSKLEFGEIHSATPQGYLSCGEPREAFEASSLQAVIQRIVVGTRYLLKLR